MSWRQTAVLAGLASTLVLISGCPKAKFMGRGPGAGHHYGQADPRVFEVYIYTDTSNPGKCLADWPVGTLWQGRHQTVEWFSDDGGKYTVDFTKGTHAPRSPFQNDTFTAPSNGKQDSGDLTAGASGYYDFAILDASGNVCKDPGDPGYYVKR
jgi:hypothetical protein